MEHKDSEENDRFDQLLVEELQNFYYGLAALIEKHPVMGSSLVGSLVISYAYLVSLAMTHSSQGEELNAPAVPKSPKVTYPIRPFGDEDISVAMSKKYEKLELWTTPIPDDPAVVTTLEQMLKAHWGLEVQVGKFDSIQGLIKHILDHFIKDHFLWITITKIEHEAPEVVSTVTPKPAIDLPKPFLATPPDALPDKDGAPTPVLPAPEATEALSCEGLSYKMYGKHVLYIKILHFDHKNLDVVLRELLRQNKDKFVIFDLGDNPGGLLDEVHQVCDIFPGERLVAKKDSTEELGVSYQTITKPDDVSILRMICFFDQSSASASEIFLADCQNRGILLYSRDGGSFGKNAVGRVEEQIVNGYRIKIYRSTGRIREGESNRPIKPNIRLPKGFRLNAFLRKVEKHPNTDPGALLDTVIKDLHWNEQ